MRFPRVGLVVTSVALWLMWAHQSPVQATNHDVFINELIAGVNGDSRVQFVEIVMRFFGQNCWGPQVSLATGPGPTPAPPPVPVPVLPPAAPSGLTAVVRDAFIDLNWTASPLSDEAAADPPSGYRIEVGTGSGLSNAATFTTGVTTTFTVAGLCVRRMPRGWDRRRRMSR